MIRDDDNDVVIVVVADSDEDAALAVSDVRHLFLIVTVIFITFFVKVPNFVLIVTLPPRLLLFVE